MAAFDPFREMDRLLGDVTRTPASVAMPMDLYRTGDDFVAHIDLPGVDPDSIDIQIERGELRIQAGRRSDAPDGARFLVRERSETTVTRRIMLGDVLDVDHVDADYEAGVLTLRIPLRETAKPRKISVSHHDRDRVQAITADAS